MPPLIAQILDKELAARSLGRKTARGIEEETQGSAQKRLPDQDVPAFLAPYGFRAINAMTWQAEPPELRIEVKGHSVVGGHTLYHIQCFLAAGVGVCPSSGGERSFPSTVWASSRRLMDLRAGLHEPVKQALGSSYRTYFCGIHFAHKMRPAGTTARLNVWCTRLAYCISKKLLPPHVAAMTLRVLGAPEAVDAASPDTLVPDLSIGPSEEGHHVFGDKACTPKEAATYSVASTAMGSGFDMGDVGSSTCTDDGNKSPANEEILEADACVTTFEHSGAQLAKPWHAPEFEETGTDEEDLTDEVLANGLPGLS